MFVFGRGGEVHVDVGAFLRIRFDEMWRAIHERDNENGLTKPKGEERSFINWNKPPHGWYALNTNGAARGFPGAAGGGDIIRNSCGSFILAISANFGVCTAFRAEVMALLKGLELARNMQITHLMIQLDNQSCMQAIRSNPLSCDVKV